MRVWLLGLFIVAYAAYAHAQGNANLSNGEAEKLKEDTRVFSEELETRFPSVTKEVTKLKQNMGNNAEGDHKGLCFVKGTFRDTARKCGD